MRGRLFGAVVIVVIALSIVGFVLARGAMAPEHESNRGIEVRLYFANLNATQVVVESRSLLVDALTSEILLRELIQGPTKEGLWPTLPEGTRLLGTEISGNVAIVNFSREAKDNHWGGSASELMTVYSVVATLTELDEVTAVQFLLEGEVLDSIWGHMDTSVPIPPDDNFIAR